MDSLPMASKGMANDAVMARVNHWETQKGLRATVTGTDGGADYLGEQWSRLVASKGITHQTTAPCTPQQNGVAER